MNEHAKGNTMYERFTAVAELNKVPGFDPLRFARKVVQNGTEKLLLDLKYKKLWFRLRYPQGRIRVTPLRITEQLAIIEATVFFDRSDKEPAAKFIAQRYAKDTPGGLYIESAQHMAAETALDDAGFGVQLLIGKEEQPAQAVVTAKTAPVEMLLAAAAPTNAKPAIAPAMQEQRLTEDTLQAAPVEVTTTAPATPTAVAETIAAQEPASVDEETAAPAEGASVEQKPVMQAAGAPPIVAAATEQPSVAEQAPVMEAAQVEQPAAVETPAAFEITPAAVEAAEGASA